MELQEADNSPPGLWLIIFDLVNVEGICLHSLWFSHSIAGVCLAVHKADHKAAVHQVGHAGHEAEDVDSGEGGVGHELRLVVDTIIFIFPIILAATWSL